MTKHVLSVSLMVLLSACAAKVDSSYPVPEIPVSKNMQTSQLHGIALSIEPFVDARLPAIQEEKNVSITQPEGEVVQQVESAFSEALKAQGVVLNSSSEKKVTGEVRRWDSRVSAAAAGSLESNATLFLEVHDAAGKSIFTGEYHGSRASSFPVIAKQDVGDSLGLAMSEAIRQAVRDPNLHNSLR